MFTLGMMDNVNDNIRMNSCSYKYKSQFHYSMASYLSLIFNTNHRQRSTPQPPPLFPSAQDLFRHEIPSHRCLHIHSANRIHCINNQPTTNLTPTNTASSLNHPPRSLLTCLTVSPSAYETTESRLNAGISNGLGF